MSGPAQFKPVLFKCQQYLKIKRAAYPGASLVAQWLGVRLPVQGTRFKPWSGRIPHAAEQLGLGATTTEPVL